MLVTESAITAIRNEFNKQTNHAIEIRNHSTRTHKDEVEAEIAIYEDCQRILNKVLNKVYSES